jgi:hypothetical protein
MPGRRAPRSQVTLRQPCPCTVALGRTSWTGFVASRRQYRSRAEARNARAVGANRGTTDGRASSCPTTLPPTSTTGARTAGSRPERQHRGDHNA